MTTEIRSEGAQIINTGQPFIQDCPSSNIYFRYYAGNEQAIFQAGPNGPLGGWKVLYHCLELYSNVQSLVFNPIEYLTGVATGAVVGRLYHGNWKHIRELPRRLSTDAWDFSRGGKIYKTVIAGTKIFGHYGMRESTFVVPCNEGPESACHVDLSGVWAFGLGFNRVVGMM